MGRTNQWRRAFRRGAWAGYTTGDGLADLWVSAIAVAPDGAVWFGTEGGVSRFDGKKWTTYRVADGSVPANGSLSRVSAHRHAAELLPRGSDGLTNNTVHAIAVAADGALWVGTDGGVSRFDGKNWTTYTPADGLASHVVTAIAVAPDGALWFGTRSGASRYLPAH